MCFCFNQDCVFLFASDVYYTCSCKGGQDCVFIVLLVMFYHNMRHLCICSDQDCVLMFVTTCIRVLKIGFFLFARDVYYNMSRVSVSRSKLYFSRLLVRYITTCIFVIKILSF